MMDLNSPRGNRPRKDLTKEQITLAIKNTKSNRAAARFLNCSYIHYKSWAKRYYEFEGGRTLFDLHINQHGRGIPKRWLSPTFKKEGHIRDIVEGRMSSKSYNLDYLKRKMIEENILKEECDICKFHERRLSDYKMPLILDFKDNNPNHFNLGNIRFLCYNCYFINVGNIFNRKELKQLETHEPQNKVSDIINFELDGYQLKRLEQLGLYEPPKPEDDGSEFISRI